MLLKLFTTFIVVTAILASPKDRVFTWSYRSSIISLVATRLIITDLLQLDEIDKFVATC